MMTSAATDLSKSPTNPPRTKVMRSKAQWQALLNESRTSGLTKTDFCKKHKISASSLHKWQKYFDAQLTGAEFIDITENLHQEAPPQSAHPGEHPWLVELELGYGMILRVRAR